MASGAAVLTTSYGSPDHEAVLPQFTAWAQKAHAGNSVVFSAFLIRMMLFSEARLCWQALDDKHLFGNTDLSIFEHPWGPDSITGNLLARMEQDAGLAGNAYIWAPPGEGRLVRLRPDWTTIISELVAVENGTGKPGYYRDKIGYWFEPPKGVTDQGKGFFVHAAEVCHWAPVPDPQADFRGMSWLTPIVREVASDDGLTQYKIRYLENSASPNLLIKYAAKLQDATVDKIRERMAARHGGVDNAFKTLVLDQGADVTVIGNSLAQMDFSNVSAAGTERILAASMVPGVLVGLEPLRGAGKGYLESMHKFADLWARPQWRSVCGALGQLVTVPAGNRLWFDTADIAALQDAAMERGQTALVNMQAILTARQAGYTRESITVAVTSGDITKLQPDPAATPPAGQPVQHMLPQSQPGATASPLPAGTQARLPLGSVSPGDGGNGTRPAPQLSAGRRSLDALEDLDELDLDDLDDGEDIDLDDLLADADSAAAGLDGPGEAARFNTSHMGAGSPKGGQFAPSGGGGSSGSKGAAGTKGTTAKPATHGPVKTAGPVTPGGGHAAQKQALHARAEADRAQARVLEKHLHALHAQMKAQVAAHHKAVAAAKAVAHHAKPGQPVHHRKAAKHHHRKARSLHARIAALRTKIRGLLTQARQLDAQAAKL
jgi:hypothetical protein